MRLARILIVLLLTLACVRAIHVGPEAPSLTLSAPRFAIHDFYWARFKPVQFTAHLRGSLDQRYLCVNEFWSWGDGSVSIQEGDCSPRVAAFRRAFQRTYYYQRPGEFEVELILFTNEPEVLVRAKTRVSIH